MAIEAIILDGCCLLNLYATGRIADVLRDLPYPFQAGSRALHEAQFIAVEGAETRELVDLSAVRASNLLEEQSLADERETALFVEFAQQMQDGEAEAAALAVVRGWALATDDRKARNRLKVRHASLEFVSTCELLYEWQTLAGIADADMKAILQRVSFGATFQPPKMDPKRDWWIALINT